MNNHSDLFFVLSEIFLTESGHFVYFRVIYNVVPVGIGMDNEYW